MCEMCARVSGRVRRCAVCATRDAGLHVFPESRRGCACEMCVCGRGAAARTAIVDATGQYCATVETAIC